MKSQQLLESFVAYCNANPELRFWQALRNWCGWNVVLVSNTLPMEIDREDLFDTFSWEETKAAKR
jgi:hypothetical protein